MQKITEFDRKPGAGADAEETVKMKSLGSRKTDKQAAGAAARKPVLSMVIFGAISLTAYIVLFRNERLITTEFTMGGWHAAYPVLTAFLFSFIHGAFASNLLSVLGLEAKKK